MKTSRLLAQISIIAATLFFILPAAKADTDAVTPLEGLIYGYVNGAAGFSFTPATNLAVTRVGYMHQNNTNPVVKFWAGTSYPIASFTLTPGTIPNDMVYSNVSLTLLAGHPYSVTLQEGPVPTNLVQLRAYVTNGVGFQVASQLAAYQGFVVTSGGVFTNFNSNALYLGPDFSFTNQTGAVAQPALKIAPASRTNALVSWPASPAGFVLQENNSLASTTWTNSTNAVSAVNGTNQIFTATVSSNKFFRLLHP